MKARVILVVLVATILSMGTDQLGRIRIRAGVPPAGPPDPHVNCSTSTCYYIRDGGSASTSGTGACVSTGSGNWNTANACDTFPTTMVRGAYYFVAGGDYGGRAFSTGTSGSSVITVKKAIGSDHGTDTGWLDIYGSTVATFTGTIDFTSSNWVWDGQTGGGPGSWKTGHGFKVTIGVGTNAENLSCSRGVSNITVSHFEAQGHSNDGTPSGTSNDGFWVGCDSLTVRYAYMHDFGRCVFFSNSGNIGNTIEFSYFGHFESTAGEHSELASLHDDANMNPVGDATDWTFRWNFITHSEGTGGLMYQGSGLKVYGNIFAPRDGNTLGAGAGGNGLIGTWTVNSTTGLLVYNNTFYTCVDRVIGLLDATDNGEFRNNLVMNCDVGNDGANDLNRLTHTHNYYISITGGPITEATQQTGSSSPFVDAANADFRLNSNTTAGTNLGSPYDVDMCGSTRTTWTRGALEFGSTCH